MRWPSFMMAQVGEGLGILLVQYINDRLLNILTTVAHRGPVGLGAEANLLEAGGDRDGAQRRIFTSDERHSGV